MLDLLEGERLGVSLGLGCEKDRSKDTKTHSQLLGDGVGSKDWRALPRQHGYIALCGGQGVDQMLRKICRKLQGRT